ncbi:hypothetical protein K443DRAFT_414034 [Laccaria amethystina LaAM-08-1]|uniref:Uncharacterized protein n=1 Tax=Laccaria amethystina LaAM-08-1 TaxID=1095629 RepID=A0A0C9X9L6_9AGAR|nr:hypothetical protein K443DRAFT_414034 [Laccaria amethystina LaAM-08-1]
MKSRSFHNRAPATPQFLQRHLYIIIHWTSFRLPSIFATLSHRQCPSSSFDHEGCTPSSHRFIPSPLTVLSWGVAALTSGWMQNSDRVRFGKVEMKGWMRRSSTGERFYG